MGRCGSGGFSAAPCPSAGPSAGLSSTRVAISSGTPSPSEGCANSSVSGSDFASVYRFLPLECLSGRLDRRWSRTGARIAGRRWQALHTSSSASFAGRHGCHGDTRQGRPTGCSKLQSGHAQGPRIGEGGKPAARPRERTRVTSVGLSVLASASVTWSDFRRLPIQ